MKPSFALDFRDGLVTLLHRTSRGWSQVGSTSFDAPDFAEALGYMRSTALGLSPRGITTKLIIPNDQSLYTAVHAPGPDAAKRKRQIRAGLEGKTPYGLDDLVYDWWGNGPDLNVAVVAKETLAEAEAFAAEHRFNPVSFVAVPDDDTFLAEPFFGASDLSASLLAEGEKVERDQDPVNVVARDFPRNEPAPKAKAEAAPEPVVARPEPVAPVAVEKPVVEAPVVAQTAAPAPPSQMPPPAMPPAAVTVVKVEPVAQPVPVAAIEPAAVQAPAPVMMPAQTPPQAAKPTPEPVMLRLGEKLAAPPEAPMALDVAAEPVAVEDDVPPSPAAEIVAAFASRRSAAIAAATAGSMKPAASVQGKIPPVGPAPSQRPSVPRPTLARPAASVARDTLPFPTKGAVALVKGAMAKPAKAGGASVTAPGILGAKRERNVVPMTNASPTADQDAAARRQATRPTNGLGSRSAPVKGKPRYLGLILTVILLVLLAAVAAWSSFFMGATDTTGTGAGTPAAASSASLTSARPAATTAPLPVASDTTSATVAAAPADPASATASNAAAPEATATPQIAASDTGSSAVGSTDPATAPAAATSVATTAPATTQPAATLEPAPKTEVSTMSAAPAVPGASGQDAIVLASADTPPTPTVPLALPVVAAGADASPAAEPPPPPYGTVYKFDADGRIIPTPEGIITPEGVLLIAGKPKPVPPDRPAELTPASVAAPAPDVAAAAPAVPVVTPAAPATDAAVAAVPVTDATTAPATPAAPATAPTGTAATGTATPATDPAATAPTATTPAAAGTAPVVLTPDPSLKGKRPKDRPADLAPPPDQQGAATGTAPDAHFASLRPLARPQGLPSSPLAPDTGADAGAAQASLAANGFALTTSPKPLARPSGLDQAVDTAVEAALNQPAPDTQLASNDAAAPEAQAEPDTEAPAPNMPTNASVAKQATTRHALNPSRVALLAVFGTPSTRFAMIRQGNGAVKKVKVGDALDGGRIAAITANSVQYQKGGRIVTLSLPTG